MFICDVSCVIIMNTLKVHMVACDSETQTDNTVLYQF